MRIMYSILNLLYSNNAKSKLIALTRKEIQEVLCAGGEKWNERTIYNHLKELEEKDYVGLGLKRGNANTYFVRPKGIAWMKEVEEEAGE